MNLLENAKNSFFIIKKIQKYRKRRALRRSVLFTHTPNQQIEKALDAFGGSFDVILVADCVYYEASVGLLVDTLARLAAAAAATPAVVLLSYEDRDSEAKLAVLDRFLGLMGERFASREVPVGEQHPDYRSEDIHVLLFRQGGGRGG